MDLNETGGGDEAIDIIEYAEAEGVGGDVAKIDQVLVFSDCAEDGDAIGIDRAPEVTGLQIS